MKPSAKKNPKAKAVEIPPLQVVGPRIFVHGLLNTDIEQIHELFSRYGQITDIFIPKESKNYVFVEYERTSQAMLAIEELHDTVQWSNKVHVRFRKRRSQEMESGCACQCHAAKGAIVTETPAKKKKTISAVFGEIGHFRFRKNRPAADLKAIDICPKANNSLDETNDESIDQPAQRPPTLDESGPSPATQHLPLQEFTLKFDDDDYFE